MKKQLRIIIITTILVLLLIVLVIRSNYDRELKVNFLNVGQGDAILIRTPSHQDILIDGGPGNKAVEEIGHLLPFYDRDIELMILTHAHSDHVSGLIEVLKRYQVEQILYSGKVLHESGDYLAWFNLIKEKSIPLRPAVCCERIFLGDQLVLEVVYPFEDFSGKRLEELNDSSLVIRLVYKGQEFLFMGDAPIKVEDELIHKGVNLESDVLKVGHHGSKYSSGPEFLELVDPQYAVIQSGAGNKFGHPHFKTINNLARLGVNILRNDECGTIFFESDGRKLKVQSEKCKVTV